MKRGREVSSSSSSTRGQPPAKRPAVASKNEAGDGSAASAGAGSAASNPLKHAFEDTDDKDHAETPLIAYQHIAPFLRKLGELVPSSSSGSSSSSSSTAGPSGLRIWDGFYCAGAVKRHLASLGFPGVHNENEDFYDRCSKQEDCPAFDVFLTNPPFSADHLERLFGGFLRNLTLRTNGFTDRKPWFVLCPDYTARKPFFFKLKEDMVAAGLSPPFYLGPSREAYSFTAPASLVDGGVLLPESSHRPINPITKTQDVLAGSFQCCWIISLGERQAEILKWWKEEREREKERLHKKEGAGKDCDGDSDTEEGDAQNNDEENAPVVDEDDPRRLPQLKIAKPLAPRERRWRKKLITAGVDPDDEDAVEAFKKRQASGGGGGGGRGAAAGAGGSGKKNGEKSRK